MLADEPTGALDTRSGDSVMNLLATINQQGQTLVMVTHDARIASTYASRLISLRDGRIVDDAILEARPSQAVSDLLRIRAEEAN